MTETGNKTGSPVTGLPTPPEVEDQRSSVGDHSLSIGVTLIIASALLGYSVATNPALNEDYYSDPGPSFQPVVMLTLLALGGLFLVLKKIIQQVGKGSHSNHSGLSLREFSMPFAMIASMSATVWLIVQFGFMTILPVFAFCWGGALAFQDHGSGAYRKVLLMAVLTSLVALGICLVFKEMIGVPLD